MVLAFVTVSAVLGNSTVRGLVSLFFGIWLGLIGIDLQTGQPRFTFGLIELLDGINVIVVAVGLFAVGETLWLASRHAHGKDELLPLSGSLWMTKDEWKRSWKPWIRGTGLGFSIGALPAGGAEIPTFLSYYLEKKLSTKPEEFGHGAIEGVAGPEAANNAGAQTAFIPLLTMGIPPNAVMALMVGAMTIHGIIPGPLVMSKSPTLFWGMVASMWIGNLLLLVINLPLIGLWVRLLKVPYRLMFPTILIFCCIGIYSINNSAQDVLFTAFFGFAGYVLYKLGFEPAPLLLGYVLGRLMEEKLRQAMILSRGSFMTFVENPIAAVLLAVAVAIVAIAVLPSVRKGREEVFVE
jgi:putative tricarboxylic transport membrane protein